MELYQSVSMVNCQSVIVRDLIRTERNWKMEILMKIGGLDDERRDQMSFVFVRIACAKTWKLDSASACQIV